MKRQATPQELAQSQRLPVDVSIWYVGKFVSTIMVTLSKEFSTKSVKWYQAWLPPWMRKRILLLHLTTSGVLFFCLKALYHRQTVDFSTQFVSASSSTQGHRSYLVVLLLSLTLKNSYKIDSAICCSRRMPCHIKIMMTFILISRVAPKAFYKYLKISTLWAIDFPLERGAAEI